jgi:DNA-binding response OmpR family regulator
MTTSDRPTVLLVEDDRATRELFSYALRLAGFAVSVASDGLSALRLLDQELPDVIVLDLDLPRISGIELREELVAHAETSAIPVIVVTGTEWAVPTPVFALLRKPITAYDVVSAVQRALRESSGPSPSHVDERRR